MPPPEPSRARLGRAGGAISLSILAAIWTDAAAKPPSLATHAASIVSYLPADAASHGCEAIGSALGLGHGLVLTAAHVLLTQSDIASACHLDPAAASRLAMSGKGFRIDVRVGRDGEATAAEIVVQGTRRGAARMSFPGSSDFALLRADGTAETASPLAPCEAPPSPGRRVVVLLPSGAVKAAVARTQSSKGADDAAYVDLDHVFEDGSSGSGVLDSATHCVLGVISHRFPEPTPRVSRFTPVAVFADAWRAALKR